MGCSFHEDDPAFLEFMSNPCCVRALGLLVGRLACTQACGRADGGWAFLVAIWTGSWLLLAGWLPADGQLLILTAAGCCWLLLVGCCWLLGSCWLLRSCWLLSITRPWPWAGKALGWLLLAGCLAAVCLTAACEMASCYVAPIARGGRGDITGNGLGQGFTSTTAYQHLKTHVFRVGLYALHRTRCSDAMWRRRATGIGMRKG